MNCSAACGVSPSGSALLPVEAAGKRADGVEIAFQIGEFVLAGVFVDALFAGFACCADRQNRRFDGCASVEAIAAADFEEADVALAVIEIPFESGGHGDQAIRTENAGFFRERIRKACGRDAFGAEKRVALFRNVRNRQDFAIAETNQTFADAQFGFVFRQALRALACSGQARRKFIEAVDARNFFDQIDFAFDFSAPGGLRAFPRGEQRAFRAAIFADSNGSKAQRAENRFDLLVGYVGTHHAKKLRARQLDFLWRAFAGIDIDDASKQFAASELQDEFGGAARGEFGRFGIGAAAEARGGFGVKFQRARALCERRPVRTRRIRSEYFLWRKKFRCRRRP